MLNQILYTILIITTVAVLARVPRGQSVDGSLLSVSPRAPELILPFNVSALPNEDSLTAQKKLKITCDSSKFGRNLKVKSCRDLFGYMRPEEIQYTFAGRDSGIKHDVGLPHRTMGNDGLCFIQPLLAEGSTVGHASSKDIFEAAKRILQNCIIERGMGGSAHDIGGDNEVQVVMAKYKPDVKCDASSTPGPPWLSCASIFTNMRAGQRVRVFGSSDQPDIDESLPWVYESEDGKCALAIDITDHSSTVSSWYEIWEATTALASMCTRWKNREGRARGLGAHKSISLHLINLPSSPVLTTGKLTNLTSLNSGAGIEAFYDTRPKDTLSQIDQKFPFELVSDTP